jgi:hypothetical protein
MRLMSPLALPAQALILIAWLPPHRMTQNDMN